VNFATRSPSLGLRTPRSTRRAGSVLAASCPTATPASPSTGSVTTPIGSHTVSSSALSRMGTKSITLASSASASILSTWKRCRLPRTSLVLPRGAAGPSSARTATLAPATRARGGSAWSACGSGTTRTTCLVSGSRCLPSDASRTARRPGTRCRPSTLRTPGSTGDACSARDVPPQPPTGNPPAGIGSAQENT
jgi:hypothetical protein